MSEEKSPRDKDWEAYEDGENYNANPFPQGTDDHFEWNDGYTEAELEAEESEEEE